MMSNGSMYAFRQNFYSGALMPYLPLYFQQQQQFSWFVAASTYSNFHPSTSNAYWIPPMLSEATATCSISTTVTSSIPLPSRRASRYFAKIPPRPSLPSSLKGKPANVIEKPIKKKPKKSKAKKNREKRHRRKLNKAVKELNRFDSYKSEGSKSYKQTLTLFDKMKLSKNGGEHVNQLGEKLGNLFIDKWSTSVKQLQTNFDKLRIGREKYTTVYGLEKDFNNLGISF